MAWRTHGFLRRRANASIKFAISLTIVGLLGLLAIEALAEAQLSAGSETITDRTDGPYLLADRDRRWVSVTVDASGQVHREFVTASDSVTVPAVRTAPEIRVRLRRTSHRNDPDDVMLAQNRPLFVVADTHGEYEILVTLLRAQGVIDYHSRWSFGNGHLVVLGDIFDRGPHQVEILWLLYELEGEARRRGGAVHVLLGNHELIQLSGDQRYLNSRYTATAAAVRVSRYADLFDRGSLLGDWLRTKASVLRLGDSLFLHGGISPEIVHAGLTVSSMNRIVRSAIGSPASYRPNLPADEQLVLGPKGPLWYRGYFQLDGNSAEASSEEVANILSTFRVNRIVVGHTPVRHVRPLYDGRAIAVQVYPHWDQVTGFPVIEAIVRLRGRWMTACVNGDRLPITILGESCSPGSAGRRTTHAMR